MNKTLAAVLDAAAPAAGPPTMRTAAPAAAYIRFIKTPYWLLLELSELLELLELLSELLELEFLFSSLAT